MKKKKIIALALATTLFIAAHTFPVSAAESAPDILPQAASAEGIVPLLESAYYANPSISISGKQISASVVIKPKKSTTSSVGTLYLEKKVGTGWTSVASWPIDATGTVNITKTYTGTTGVTYRTRVVVTTGVDKIDTASAGKTV